MMKVLLLLLIGLSSLVRANELEALLLSKKPLELVNLLFTEIKMKKEIPIHLFKRVIHFHGSQEFVKNKNYKSTISLLKKLENMELSSLKKAFIYKKLCNLHRHINQIAQSVFYAEKSIKIYYEYSLEANLKRMKLLMNLAGQYRKLKKDDQAEKLFIRVMSYPWFSAKGDYLLQTKKMYIAAGKELIDVRRGHLLKLKSTYFYPMAHKELQPLLKEAIENANGKYEAPSLAIIKGFLKSKKAYGINSVITDE